MPISSLERTPKRRATLFGRIQFALHYLFFYSITLSRLMGMVLQARLSRLLLSGKSASNGKRLSGFRLLEVSIAAMHFCRDLAQKLILRPLIRWARYIQCLYHILAQKLTLSSMKRWANELQYLCHVLVEKIILATLKRWTNNIKHIHKNISSRALYALVDSCADQRTARNILGELSRRILEGYTQPYLLLSTIMLALKTKEFDVARCYASVLLRNYPDAYNEHHQAGIWFFIGGHYGDAEKIWGDLAERRERTIREEGLDRLNMRLLGQSWLLAIGHIAHIDSYLKHKILSGRGSQRTIVPLPPIAKVPNMALLNCWAKHVEIRSSEWVSGLNLRQIELLQDEFWSIRMAPGDTRMFSHAGAQVQSDWDRRGYGPLLTLPPDMEERGWRQMEALGVPCGHWFVCLHVREPGFHKAWHEKHPGVRNADVLTYLKAVQRIIDHGGYVVRVGDATMTKLLPQDGLIDYAHSDKKSEEMDVFLCAKARFFIGTNSGLGLVPPIFGVPCALTNWAPIALPQWYSRDRFIPKTIYSAKLGRALSLAEVFSSPAAWQQFQSYFDSVGLKVQDNSAEEIEELIIELLEETSGKNVLSADDGKLVQGYNRLALQHGSYVGARLGRAYLRRHADELSRIAAQGVVKALASTEFCCR